MTGLQEKIIIFEITDERNVLSGISFSFDRYINRSWRKNISYWVSPTVRIFIKLTSRFYWEINVLN